MKPVQYLIDSLVWAIDAIANRNVYQAVAKLLKKIDDFSPT
jgi:hypothetical protein